MQTANYNLEIRPNALDFVYAEKPEIYNIYA